jgi:hypothetical protein
MQPPASSQVSRCNQPIPPTRRYLFTSVYCVSPEDLNLSIQGINQPHTELGSVVLRVWLLYDTISSENHY